MDHKDLCEHTRIRLIAAAVGHQQCTKTASNIIPIPGGRVIAIGTPAEVRALLGAAPLATQAAPTQAAPADGAVINYGSPVDNVSEQDERALLTDMAALLRPLVRDGKAIRIKDARKVLNQVNAACASLAKSAQTAQGSADVPEEWKLMAVGLINHLDMIYKALERGEGNQLVVSVGQFRRLQTARDIVRAAGLPQIDSSEGDAK